MARIAFHMSPEFSHLAPTYRLAKQLLDRGHQVSYLQPPDFADEIRAQGLGFAPIFEHIYPRGLHEVLDAMDRDARVAATRALEVALCASYERGHAEPALRAAAPDLLLVDPLQVPMSFVAEKLGIRAALITPFMPQGHDPGVPRMFTPAQLPRTALGRLGVELGWRWFQDKRAVRRAIDRALMLAALASRPALDGVIVTGTPRWSATLPPPPPNVTLVRWARPLEILPGAALSITHGGLGSVKESLYFGVPMIVLPQANDQFGTAARITYHGYGRAVLDPPGSVEELSAAIGGAIDAVLGDTALRRRVGELAARLRARDASDHAPRAVEACLQPSTAR